MERKELCQDRHAVSLLTDYSLLAYISREDSGREDDRARGRGDYPYDMQR